MRVPSIGVCKTDSVSQPSGYRFVQQQDGTTRCMDLTKSKPGAENVGQNHVAACAQCEVDDAVRDSLIQSRYGGREVFKDFKDNLASRQENRPHPSNLYSQFPK